MEGHAAPRFGLPCRAQPGKTAASTTAPSSGGPRRARLFPAMRGPGKPGSARYTSMYVAFLYRQEASSCHPLPQTVRWQTTKNDLKIALELRCSSEGYIYVAVQAVLAEKFPHVLRGYFHHAKYAPEHPYTAVTGSSVAHQSLEVDHGFIFGLYRSGVRAMRVHYVDGKDAATTLVEQWCYSEDKHVL
jgi:hypothetical protein